MGKEEEIFSDKFEQKKDDIEHSEFTPIPPMTDDPDDKKPEKIVYDGIGKKHPKRTAGIVGAVIIGVLIIMAYFLFVGYVDVEPFDASECDYEFDDGFIEEEISVFVSGEILLSSLTIGEGGVMNITGTFHIEEDESENAIWVQEKGTVTIGFCDEDEETEVEGIPFCIETTGFVTDGMGIFEGFTGRFESEGHGYITSFDESGISGITFRTVWIFFEEQPKTPVQSGGGKGCSGECNPPTMSEKSPVPPIVKIPFSMSWNVSVDPFSPDSRQISPLVLTSKVP